MDKVELGYRMMVFKYDGDWIGEFVDLPGCTGVGDTPEEAVKSANESLVLWLADYFEEHGEYPQGHRVYEVDF